MSRLKVFSRELDKIGTSLYSAEVAKESLGVSLRAKTSTLRVHVEVAPGGDVSKNTIKLWNDNARKRMWNLTSVRISIQESFVIL